MIIKMFESQRLNRYFVFVYLFDCLFICSYQYCCILPSTFQLHDGHLAPNVSFLINFPFTLQPCPFLLLYDFFLNLFFSILISIFLLCVLLSVPHLKPPVAPLRINCMFISVLSCRNKYKCNNCNGNLMHSCHDLISDCLKF